MIYLFFFFFSSCFYVGEKTDLLFEHKTTRIHFPSSSSSLFSNLLVSMFVFFSFYSLSLSHDKSFTMHVFKKQKCLAACVFSLFSLASACGMIYILLYTYIYIYIHFSYILSDKKCQLHREKTLNSKIDEEYVSIFQESTPKPKDELVQQTSQLSFFASSNPQVSHERSYSSKTADEDDEFIPPSTATTADTISEKIVKSKSNSIVQDHSVFLFSER